MINIFKTSGSNKNCDFNNLELEDSSHIFDADTKLFESLESYTNSFKQRKHGIREYISTTCKKIDDLSPIFFFRLETKNWNVFLNIYAKLVQKKNNFVILCKSLEATQNETFIDLKSSNEILKKVIFEEIACRIFDSDIVLFCILFQRLDKTDTIDSNFIFNLKKTIRMLKKDIKNKKKLFLAMEILVIYRIALKRYIKIIFEITKNIEKKPVEIILHKIKNDALILSLTMSLYYSIENFLQSYQLDNYDLCWSNIDYWICRKYFGKYIIRYQFISDAFLIVKNLESRM
ncbi:hypothetical protein GVAV_001214 [Gurleya vavrai]